MAQIACVGPVGDLPHINVMLGHLRSSSEFGRVKREGSFWGGRKCSINAARRSNPAVETGTPAPAESLTRIGLITSKRVGNAVQRNRARRLMRESIRSLDTMIEASWDIVVIAHPAISASGVGMQDVRDELQWLLKKARLVKPS